MEALSYSMATRREKCIPGLPLEISRLVERVRKRRFYNNFFHSAYLIRNCVHGAALYLINDADPIPKLDR
jgi:hypothetical protein